MNDNETLIFLAELNVNLLNGIIIKIKKGYHASKKKVKIEEAKLLDASYAQVGCACTELYIDAPDGESWILNLIGCDPYVKQHSTSEIEILGYPEKG